MTDAFIDCSMAGATGDMLTAALLDVGAPRQPVKQAMQLTAEKFGGAKIKINRVKVGPFTATRVKIQTKDKGRRKYSEVKRELAKLKLPTQTRARVLNTINRIAKAEAKIHGKKTSDLTLHEVSAADALASIVGACTAARELGLLNGRILVSQIAVGNGNIKTSHGTLPIPAPATLEILKGATIQGGPTKAELTTPTGAALLATLASKYVNTFPTMRVNHTGYGTTSRNHKNKNLLRVTIGKLTKPTRRKQWN